MSSGGRWRTVVAGALLIVVAAACGSSGDVDTTSNNDRSSSQPQQSGVLPGEIVPIIVDTDVSLDDVMAIMYLVRRPDIDVRAITVSGTGVAHCDAGVSIVLGLLSVAGMESVPVACGAEAPLDGSNSFPAPWRDARDSMAMSDALAPGVDPAAEPAAAVITAAAAASPTPPMVVLLGPHTNLAQALRDDADLEAMLAGVHMMGGAIEVPGNTLDNPDAEWNLWIDPVAAAEVFATDIPLTVVPLDATRSVPLTDQLVDLLAANLGTPEAEATLGLVRSDPTATSGLFMWDQLAVVALVEPAVVSWVDLDLAVDPSTDPRHAGTLVAGSGRTTRVALVADRSTFEAEYLSTLTGRSLSGSGGEPPTSAAQAEYIARADAVCATADVEVEAVYDAVLAGFPPDAEPTAELFGELWSRLEPILRSQLVALRDITPPADDAATLDALYREFDDTLREVERVE